MRGSWTRLTAQATASTTELALAVPVTSHSSSHDISISTSPVRSRPQTMSPERRTPNSWDTSSSAAGLVPSSPL